MCMPVCVSVFTKVHTHIRNSIAAAAADRRACPTFTVAPCQFLCNANKFFVSPNDLRSFPFALLLFLPVNFIVIARSVENVAVNVKTNWECGGQKLWCKTTNDCTENRRKGQEEKKTQRIDWKRVVLRLNRLSMTKGNNISTRSMHWRRCMCRVCVSWIVPVWYSLKMRNSCENESPFKWSTEAYIYTDSKPFVICDCVPSSLTLRPLLLYLTSSFCTHTNFGIFSPAFGWVCACNCIILAFPWKWKTFRKCHINIYFVLKLHKITIGCQLHSNTNTRTLSSL